MNNARRLMRTMASISRYGKLSPAMFKGINLSAAKIAKPRPLPSGVEARINSVRIVNFNANQLLLNNVFALSGFGPSSLEELLEKVDEEDKEEYIFSTIRKYVIHKSKMKPVNGKDQTHMIVGRVVVHLIDRFEEQRENDPGPHPKPLLTKFHSRKLPKITIADYMKRVHNYVNCSTSCYLIALVYIDRVIQRNSSFILTKHNAHRLLMASIVVAIKFYDDTFFSNEFYSKVAGVPCAEMNLLEGEILKMISYHLWVEPEEYNKYKEKVEQVYEESVNMRKSMEMDTSEQKTGF